MTHNTIVYFSGIGNHPKVFEKLITAEAHVLYTFADPNKVHKYLAACDAYGKKARVMIDSGAFTAWNIGKPVRVDDLIAYNRALLQRYPQHEFLFIALDMIPGERGRTATQDEIHAAVDESYQNFLHMQQSLPGSYVLPVYHSGEERSVRDRYLQHAPYICLSMNQNLMEKHRLKWAREAYVPGFYFHGLAATGNEILNQVDWYSVDSTGFLVDASFGTILIPIGNTLKPLSLSDVSPLRKTHGKHLTNMNERQFLLDYIHSRGYDEKALSEEHTERVCWNIEMWLLAPWKKNIIQPEGLFQ